MKLKIESQNLFTKESVTSDKKVTTFSWEELKRELQEILDKYDLTKIEIIR